MAASSPESKYTFDDNERPKHALHVDAVTVAKGPFFSPLEVEMQPLTDADTRNDNKEELSFYPTDAIHGKRQDWRTRLDHWLYPPQLPREVQLLRPENIAVPVCYLLVGILQGLLSPLINVLPLDLGATEAQQTTMSSIKSLPR
jgi:hypothetical protein